MQPLAALLRSAAAEPAAADLSAVRGVSRLLWQLSVVRCASPARPQTFVLTVCMSDSMLDITSSHGVS